MELICSLCWGFHMWFKELCHFSVCVFWTSYLISAFGLGLADSVNIWLLRNPKVRITSWHRPLLPPCLALPL